jgi:hypothetical protein
MGGSTVNWSVRLLLTEDASSAFSRPERWPIHPSVRSMTVGGSLDDDIEDAPFVTLELVAEDADAAERLAQDLACGVGREVGDTRTAFPVVWVAPLEDSEVSSHRFLEEAKFLFESEQYELAVVAAHIHFEVQLRLLLERAARRADRRWAERLIKNRGIASLNNDVSVGTVELLLQIDVRRTRQWPEFSAHINRRNAVVHKGHSVRSQEARASIKVVEALWATLAEAERSSTLF